MGSRVFVRLYDGEKQRETDDVVLTLPPPPLKWPAVLSAMVAALDRADDDEDDDDDEAGGGAAAATIAPERIAKARLFLLPSESQGIVAELNARGLRGIRENDRFVVCLHSEDYQKRAEKKQAVEAAAESSAVALTTATVLPEVPMKLNPLEKPLPAVMAVSCGVEYPQPSFASTAASAPTVTVTSAAPPPGMGGFTSLGTAKGNKRYRSISGKMAAIKSLGDKGLISADDRGHLKDLLLNNDSPQLQEALDQYNNTGDFQAVKAILLKELSAPSTKRAAGGDWISETLINDITMTFNTSSGPSPMAAGTISTQPANPFLYHAHESDSSSSTPSSAAEYQHQQHQPQFVSHASPVSMGYTASDYSSATVSSRQGSFSPAYQQHPHVAEQHGGLMAASDPYGASSYYGGGGGGLPQVNLPMRNRNSVNLMMKQGGYGAAPVPLMSPTHMDMRYGGAVTAGATGYPNQMGASPMYSPNGVGYGSAEFDSRLGMSAYGMISATTGEYSSAMLQQQQQQSYGMARYSYGATGMVGGGYEYYPSVGYSSGSVGVGGGALGGIDKNQMRSSGGGGKWTTAPPMPSYPPACSKEEKKEKIAKWLKKRENRNWSNKPSYPVRHSIAKSRKRGEDGRFITKARLAEMALEAAANGGTNINGSDGIGDSMEQLHHSESAGAFDDYDPHMAMASLAAPTSVP